jgi:hypothetical protein
MVDYLISLLIRLVSGGGDGLVVVAVLITAMFWGYVIGRTVK